MIDVWDKMSGEELADVAGYIGHYNGNIALFAFAPLKEMIRSMEICVEIWDGLLSSEGFPRTVELRETFKRLIPEFKKALKTSAHGR